MSTSFSAGRASMAAAFRLLVSALHPERARRRLMKVAALLLTLLTIGAAHASAQEVVEYYGYDAIGSMRVVLDVQGNVMARVDYLPFGEEAGTSQGAPSQRYAGHERDNEEGLYYFGARSYQARTGRFTQVDPLFGAALITPQLWNRYAYALNSPLVFTDPDGRQAAANCKTQTGFITVGGETYYVSDGTCVEGGGGDGGGGGGGLDWFMLKFLDTTLGTTSVGGPESELVPTGRGRGYVPSKTTEIAADMSMFVLAAVIPGDQGETKATAQAAVNKVDELFELLKDLAKQAADKMGSGNGAPHGTKTHSVFERLVKGLGRGDLNTEMSYKGGELVRRGTPGSVRADVVQGPVEAPNAIYDLKTGGAMLTDRRVDQIQSHIPGGKAPVVQVKP
jgi:RHS repeat-associated protein